MPEADKAATPPNSPTPTTGGGERRTLHAPLAPPPPPSSLLDPPETTSHRFDPDQCPSAQSNAAAACPESEDAAFRHSGWRLQRDATWSALRRVGVPGSRVTAFEECGARAFVYASTIGPEDYTVKGSHCHDRFCVPCATARSFAVMKRLEARAAQGELSFITLTVLNRKGEALRDQLDRLYAGFRQLRRLDLWENAVKGGAAVCEVKRTKHDRWHCHLHIIADTAFIDQRELSRAWRACTTDSFIVHIRRVVDTAADIRYTAKYAGKPMDSGFWKRPELLEESILALRGRRLIVTFGTWYKSDPNIDDEEGDTLFRNDPRAWKPICTVATLWRRAAEGDYNARRVVASLRLRDPMDGSRCTRPPPRDFDCDAARELANTVADQLSAATPAEDRAALAQAEADAAHRYRPGSTDWTKL